MIHSSNDAVTAHAGRHAAPHTRPENPVRALPTFGQSVWLDDLHRINPMTPATLDAFRDHGRLRSSLEDNLEEARATLTTLKRVRISLDDVTDRLLEDGIALFCKAFDDLLAAVDRARRGDIAAPAARNGRAT